MKVKHTSTHAHKQATRLVAKSKRLSARPTMLLSAIALVCSGSSAFAACDTATITGVCEGLLFPNAAGKVNYIIDANAKVRESPGIPGVGSAAVDIAGQIGAFTNNGLITIDTAKYVIPVWLKAGGG